MSVHSRTDQTCGRTWTYKFAGCSQWTKVRIFVILNNYCGALGDMHHLKGLFEITTCTHCTLCRLGLPNSNHAIFSILIDLHISVGILLTHTTSVWKNLKCIGSTTHMVITQLHTLHLVVSRGSGNPDPEVKVGFCKWGVLCRELHKGVEVMLVLNTNSEIHHYYCCSNFTMTKLHSHIRRRLVFIWLSPRLI